MKQNLGCLERAEPSEHFFSGIEKETLQKFDCVGACFQLENGAEIFREGDPCKSVHLLCSGTAKLFATSREGRRMILRIAHPGEILGLPAAMAA